MKFLSPKRTITRRRTRNRNDIFGGNLAELLQREKSSIPRILKDCVEVIETRGIEEVGIYRVSSVVSEVQKIKELYSKNPNLALMEIRQKSAHLAANALKLYLRELPDPLFTTHLYHRFMSAIDLKVPEFRIDELRRIFNELPEINRNIIIFLLNHLNNIASHSDKNMMGLQNLCTLFGPTLMKLSPKEMRQVDDMAKEIRESMQQASVLFYLLQMHSDDNLLIDPLAKQQLQQQRQQHSQMQLDSSYAKLTLASRFPPQIDSNNNNMTSNKVNNRQPITSQPSSSKPNNNIHKTNMQTAL